LDIKKFAAAAIKEKADLAVVVTPNKRTGSIHIIEINPRMAYKFADMFEKVDETNSYVKEGDWLSDLSQDETSYRYAMVNLGGKDWADLYTRFEDLKKYLRFEFAPALGNSKDELG
jgi:hypothetical protein